MRNCPFVQMQNKHQNTKSQRLGALTFHLQIQIHALIRKRNEFGGLSLAPVCHMDLTGCCRSRINTPFIRREGVVSDSAMSAWVLFVSALPLI